MLKGELPRQYYFYQGDFFCAVNFEALAKGGLVHDKRVIARAEALKMLHLRAASYKRPFNIEAYAAHTTARGIGMIANVLLASRGNVAGPPYKYISLGDRNGHHRSSSRSFATATELLLYFEDLMTRFFVGDEDAL